MEKFMEYLSILLSLIPAITVTSVLEIVIISFLIYEFLQWIMDSRAWTLLKGIGVIISFTVFAYVLNLDTIMWLLEKASTIVVIVIAIIFQPELRRALEQLGSQQFLDRIGFSSAESSRRMARETCKEVAGAVFSMAKVCTGALIAVERNESLGEFVDTGILINGRVSSGLLINIFEKNTPLHDGAVVIRGNEILAATCYLPLSDSITISKELGTRHRAAIGLSEVSDSLVIVVSEETGRVSVAHKGVIRKISDPDTLENMLFSGTNKHSAGNSENKKREFTIPKLWKKSGN